MSPIGDFGWIIVWVLWLVTLALFAYRGWILIRLLRLGKPDDRFKMKDLPKRTGALILYVVGHINVLRDRLAGGIHAVIFLGFIIYAVSFVFMLLHGLFPIIPGLGQFEEGNIWAFVMDVGAVITTLAIAGAAFRRWVMRPARVTNTFEAAFILMLIFSVVLTAVFMQAGRLVADSAGYEWSPLSWLVAQGLSNIGVSAGAGEVVYMVMWWLHLIIVMFFMMYILYSKHLHIPGCPANEFLVNFEPRGKLNTIDLENSETFGVAKINDYTWKQLLDLYACTECGRCKENCPTALTGKPLKPKEFIGDLKHHLLEEGPKVLAARAKVKGEEEPEHDFPPLLENLIEKETAWACTTCGYCQENCPVSIEHPQKLIDLRRNLVLMETDFPAELKPFFKNMETQGNPYQISLLTRGDWAAEIGVPTLADNPNPEILYWVGCAGSFDDRNKKVSVALAKTMQAAGVNFAILGAEEKCCGDPVRRIGNEYLFQMLAAENIEVMKGYGVKKIVTQCPHCLNTLKNEYPTFGGEFEVVHYTEYIIELLAAGRLELKKPIDLRVAYHDACYLGRYNKVYEDPRVLLQAVPAVKLLEMDRKRGKSFCCGGGGGRAFMEEHLGTRINLMRMDEALKTDPQVIGTACPYCLNMFEDAITSKGVEESIKAQDIIEIVAKAL